MKPWRIGLGIATLVALLVTTPMLVYGQGKPVPVPTPLPPSPIWTLLQAYSEWGRIGGFETGWSEDTMAVFMAANVPFINPGKCRVTNSYALDPSEPGNHAHEAALMGAYFNGKSVRLLINGCVYDKPRIIAVGVQD